MSYVSVHPYLSVHKDAWSNGQIDSKLWLCRTLESLKEQLPQKPLVIWIYGCWYSLAAFMLLSREQLPIYRIRGFDLDENACNVADALNENWVIKEWTFKAFARDCNTLNPAGSLDDLASPTPDLIINTSCEHFESREWWDAIPQGTWVALQSANLPHPEHVNTLGSATQVREFYGISNPAFLGELDFRYSPDNSFRRSMVIGRK